MGSKEDDEPLTRDNLTSEQGLYSLGLVAARHLLERGICALFLDANGQVEIAGPGEFGLDALPEEQAIQELAAMKVSDDDIATYLKGRDARIQHKLEAGT